MAIKDSLISDILKTSNRPLTSQHLYKRLRPDSKNIIDKPDLNWTQTEHKPNTNWAQTEHKLGTETDTNRTQTGHKEHKPNTNWAQTEHKLDTELDTNRTQTEHKLDTKRTQDEQRAAEELLSSLVGLQREILLFLFHNCKIARSSITEAMSLVHIAESLKIRIGSVKTTLMRLTQKKFIIPVGFKNGRGGWRKYEIPNEIYKELIHMEHTRNFIKTEHKLDTNRIQMEHKPDTKLDTTNASSSGSLKTNKTTTTSEPEQIFGLSSEWLEMDITPISEFGFTQTHLEQIIRHGKLEAGVVQQSILAFAFDLTHNGKAKKIKGSPLNFFMGILRNGSPYAPPDNYESPQEEAMRVYLERQTELHEKKKQVEEGILNLHFETWMDELTESQITEILPPNALGMCKPGSPARRGMLSEHYRENIWSEKKQAILKNIAEESAPSEPT